MDEVDTLTITKRSVHGVLALISRQFVLQIISTASALVIYTFLTPIDVGIYTAVIAFQRIISFFADFGFGAALVQKKDEITRDDIRTTFTLQAGVTLFIFLVVFSLRGTISNFFHFDSQGENLMLALVFTVFLSSFKTIPSILLERSIKFSKLIIPQIIEQLTFHTILMVLVFNRFGLGSYTWAFLVSSLISIPFYFFVSRWTPGIGISRHSLNSLRYGLQFQAKNILATIKDDFLTVILTRFLSFTEIGYIGFAQRIAFLVYRYVVDSVTKVTFSTYSRFQENTDHLKKAIEKSLFFVSAAMFPSLAGVMICFPYIVAYFPRWQGKWEPAMLSLIFFCLNAMVSSLSGILVNVLDATGRVRTTLKLMAIWTILTWTLTPILIHFYGYNGVAIASFIITLTIVYTILLVKKIVQFSLIKSIYMPFATTIIMSFILYFLARNFVHDLISLLFVILLGGLVYLGVFLLLAGRIIIGDIKAVRAKS